MKKIFTLFLLMTATVAAMAQLVANTTYTSDDFNNSATTLDKNAASWDGGVKLTNAKLGFDWTARYVVIALADFVPNRLTCTTQQSSVASTGGGFKVYESDDNATWTVAKSIGLLGSTSAKAQTVDLKQSTRYIKLEWSGNFNGFYKNIQVSEWRTTYTTVTDTICQDSYYEMGDVRYSAAGTYVDTLQMVGRGDSIVTLNLWVAPTDTTELFYTIHVNEELQLGDTTLVYEEEGEHTLVTTLVNVYGCDSLVVERITVIAAEQSVPTAMETIAPTKVAEKIYRNGTLYIRREEGLYDMTGRKVED